MTYSSEMTVREVLAASRENRVDALLRGLNSTERDARLVSARHLGKLRVRGAVQPPIRVATLSVDVGLRVCALNALGRIGDASASDALYAIATSKTEYAVRMKASSALADIGDTRGVDLLIGFLGSDLVTVEGLSSREARTNRRWLLDVLARHPSARVLETLRVNTRKGRTWQRLAAYRAWRRAKRTTI